MKKFKIYELTTNEKDGYCKYYVKGIKNDFEAVGVSFQAFGIFAALKLVSFYDVYPSPYKHDWSKTPTKKKFIKQMQEVYKQYE